MKNFFQSACLLAFALLAITSCKKAVPDQTKYIPKDAGFVFDLNWKSLSDKASKGNINWDSLYRSAASESGDDTSMAKFKKEFSDFVRSGIDTTTNIFFFIRSGGSIMSGQTTTGGVVAALKDATAFENYIKKRDNAPEIKKGSNFSYTTIKDNLLVGWNDDVVILTGSETSRFRFDSSGSMSEPGANTGSADQTLATLFTQKEEESIASIPEFRDLMNEKADMLFWSNSGSMLNAIPMLGFTKLADLFKDSYGAGTINFENGKAVADFKSYSGKDLADILKKYNGHEVDMSFVNRYPYPVSGFAAFSFNPQIFNEIIKYAGLESTVTQFLQKEGFTLDDILKAFKGDFTIVFSDIATADKEYDQDGMKFHTSRPTAKLVFNATIGDKAAYDKIAAKLAEQGLMEMKNGQYVPAHMGDELAWNMDGKNLTVATDNELLQQYLTGKGNAAVPANVANNAKGKSVVFYVDINKILQSFNTTSPGKSIEAAKATFKNMVATSSNFNGKYVESDFELNTINNNENSLVSLIKFFVATSEKIEEQQRRLRNGMMNMDSTDMTMPPQMPTPEDEK